MQNNKIRIQSLLILLAFENSNRTKDYFLNLDTGEIVNHSSSPECYLKIENYSKELNSVMVDSNMVSDFITTIEEREPRERLFMSFLRYQTTREFENILFDYPALRDEWFRCREEITLKSIKRWLSFHKINAVLV